jgi:hypothetical protein
MRQALAFVTSCSALAGCSWIYNPNNLPGPSDAATDAEIILDSNARLIDALSVVPMTIYEGQGDFGSAPALVVIFGHQFVDDHTMVQIMASTSATAPMLEVGTPVIAKNGNWIAVPVTAHVDRNLHKTDRIVLDVKVTETVPDDPAMGTSMSTLPGQLALQGLEELMPGATATIDTATLDAMYSKVELSVATTFKGTGRAIVHSVSSITTKGLIANGLAGGAAGATSLSVGGCGGGGPGSTGGCDGTIGGKGGMNGALLGGAGGGGGGGFADNGASGTGNGAGAAGSRTGDELIVTYDGTGARTENRSAGGGGGGTPTLASAGGAGGGGGGSIELSAGGDIAIGGDISANGGNGATVGGSTGGGGGAGGLVMLRADGTLTASGSISVNGGAGGAASSTSVGGGGTGSHGRVRWDAAAGTAPAIALPATASGTLHRGPAFTLATRLFRAPVVKISMVGTPNDRFNVYTENGGKTSAGPQISIGSDGTVVFDQTLQQGLSHLCVTLEGGQQGASEADKCVDVAFLP